MNSRGTYYIIFKKSEGEKYFMKTYKKEITVYDFEGIFDGFCVEVEVGDKITDMYLCHKDYSVKKFMFAINTKDESEIRNIIAANIEEEIKCYIDRYAKDYIYDFADVGTDEDISEEYQAKH